MNGTLYLFPTPIGENETYNCMPLFNGAILQTCEGFVVEEISSARKFLRKAGFNKNFDQIAFYELNEHTDTDCIDEYLELIYEGKNLGLLSEAGLPCVADPGWQLVRLAHQHRIKVVPLAGASSLMLALMASGLCGQNFAFVGYLPAKTSHCEKAIQALEHKALQDGQVQIFIEAPYRNNRLLGSILKVLHADTILCVATDLMLPSEQIITKSAAEWRKIKWNIHKRNSVFLIGRQE
ncbi:MAG: SAM-dependent methyltransferase [Bacteroidales bacterium]|jgi:16S rRNA (cytidine1402-2'-O)-methyltransferase|nr:SAM-dependent methyltransferase [Bacteroidales bacterium]